MAMDENSYAESKKDGLLDISAKDYYFDTIRPFMNQMLLKCRTDGELMRTIEKVINASDSFCTREDYEMVSESFDVLEASITDKNYFNGVMKKAPEEERQMVRDLISKISDLRMIIQCEQPNKPKKMKIKNRIGFKEPTAFSPNGENEDYINHNMKNLNKPNPKKRLPNV